MLHMTKNISTGLLALLMAGASVQAFAFDTDQIQQNQSAYAEQFNQLDVSGNGLLTWGEAKKDKSLNSKHFTRADKDNDHALDQEEYAEIKTTLGQQKVSQVVSDSVITTKAKAKLLADESFKSLKISVETFRGVVILSGFVSDERLKEQAEAVVTSIDGVKSVKNGLVVKS